MCCACCAGRVFNSLRGSRLTKTAIHTELSPFFFDNCTFRGLSSTKPGLPKVGERVWGAIHAGGLNATLALRNCTLQDIRSEFAIGLEHTEVDSDEPGVTVRPEASAWGCVYIQLQWPEGPWMGTRPWPPRCGPCVCTGA